MIEAVARRAELDSSVRSEWSIWKFLLAAVVFGVIVYHAALIPGEVAFTTDDNVGAIALRKASLPHAFLGGWDDSSLVGYPSMINLSWTNLVLCVLSPKMFVNLIHLLDLVLATLFLGLFLRARGLSRAAAAMGCLTTLWLGSTFFLTYAGHIGKFGVVLFASLYLWLVEKAVSRDSWGHAVLAGGAMGAMFLEQADVALFFAIPLGFYAVFSAWRKYGANLARIAAVAMPIVVVAGLLAFRPMWTAYSLYSLDTPQESGRQDKNENWDYCTQWSWPPDETIEFVAPGYMGWRSGEPDGPYWGRMGRSSEWETTRQGFMNFKLETFYLGAIPFALFLFGGFRAFAGRRQGRDERLEVIFWLGTAVVTFLLAIGKYFPLYAFFFKLPGISSIRNPVKFMQVTQMAVGIIAAMGMDFLLRARTSGTKSGAPDRGPRLFSGIILAIGAVFLLWTLGLMSSESRVVGDLASAGWGDASAVIVQNQVWGLAHATLMFFAAFGFVFVASGRLSDDVVRKTTWVLIGLVMFDQLMVSRHYVKSVSEKGYVDRNTVVDFFKANLGSQRVLLLSQQSFYNQWLSVLFPYYGISTFNVAQARLPEDYKQYLASVGKNPQNLWRTFAVGYLIGPGGAWSQFQNEEPFKGRYDLRFAFNVGPADGGVIVFPASSSQPGQHVIIQQTRPAPRYALIGAVEKVSDSEALRRLSAPDADLFSTVLVPDNVTDVPALAAKGSAGNVTVQAYQPGKVRVQVSADRPAILRAADKYDPRWNAWIDGRPVKLFRCDYLFQGICIEPGLHTVELMYSTDAAPLWVQVAGMGLCVIALGRVLLGALVCRPPGVPYRQ